ncbi:hypothetical protein EV361DRAFT_933620 [Lentinula raphanica]|nr:hypothetical protein EV361DRAFT_933620 [Lentinula raphanica]
MTYREASSNCWLCAAIGSLQCSLTHGSEPQVHFDEPPTTLSTTCQLQTTTLTRKILSLRCLRDRPRPTSTYLDSNLRIPRQNSVANTLLSITTWTGNFRSYSNFSGSLGRAVSLRSPLVPSGRRPSTVTGFKLLRGLLFTPSRPILCAAENCREGTNNSLTGSWTFWHLVRCRTQWVSLIGRWLLLFLYLRN